MTAIAIICIAAVVASIAFHLLRWHRADTEIVHQKPRELNQTLYSVLKGRRRRP